jgi:hypothetical protein
LLSNERVQRIREFACGHGAPAITARLHSRLLTKPNKCASRTGTRHLQQHTETIIDHGREFRAYASTSCPGKSGCRSPSRAYCARQVCASPQPHPLANAFSPVAKLYISHRLLFSRLVSACTYFSRTDRAPRC